MLLRHFFIHFYTFLGVAGLKLFKIWIDTADQDELMNNGKDCGTKMKRTKTEVSKMSEMNKFKYIHRKARRRWRLTDGFPSQQGKFKEVNYFFQHPHIFQKQNRIQCH